MKRLEQLSTKTRKWIKLYQEYMKRTGASIGYLESTQVFDPKHQAEAIEYLKRIENEKSIS